ncbi:MAG: CDP-glycerol glycerophosphotransferase family protein [Myxococcota bacterium]|nr:CDP-glycerol glycerophosphotransferase family protein [Myxococcota bacterium]
MNRKLRKLLTNPLMFGRDAVSNRVDDVKRRLPRVHKRRSAHRYSVVAAVYGVEKYLEEFFRSMVRQSLDFERHIQLIMVDDGSPDRSAEIIGAWQKKYPRSIKYVRKENGGQASARNVGLEHATGDWVTFVDPDDFLDETFFEHASRFLDRSDAQRVALVSCNFILYDDKTGRSRDAHPLRYRFTGGNRVVPIAELTNDMQLSASTALFRRDLLRSTGLEFDEGIRPSFEDAHFTNRYLLATSGRDVAFVPGAKYYYRKREDESSTLDRAWTVPSQFDVVLDRGCGDLFRQAAAQSESGEVPVWLQRAVLYHLIWYFKRLVNGSEHIGFLSDEQRTRFRALLDELFSKIDPTTILEFELGGAWLFHKIGILGLFKGTQPDFQHVYVQDYDPTKKLAQARYFYRGEAPLEIFMIDGQEIFPRFAKSRRHELLGETFVDERIVWLPVGDLSGHLRIDVGGLDTRIVLRGKIHRDGLPVRDIGRLRRHVDVSRLPLDVRLEHHVATSALAQHVYQDAFVFMDRDTQADDNAEHLYRYVHQNRADINAFFVLRRSSHDWERLEREGFRLLAFGSLAHRLAMRNAKHLISSHADHYVVSFPYEKDASDPRTRRFTFLQHGVTKDDISGWMNTKNIDCFVTASPAEHASIVESGSPYKFTDREVVLSGFPRHDALGANAPAPERLLAIMPTWRQSLVGATKGAGNERQLNPAFYESEYAQTWRALLHSPELRALVDEHGYRVQFFPHANIQPYLSWFAPPAYIETVSHRPERSMQEVFRAAAIMLTDYSSTVFEMAYLRRPVLYYQFDRELVFGGGHLTKKGYFDYDRDGFGPVCLTQPALLDALSEILAAGETPAPEYLARMERTFAFRDGRACERTLDAILALDDPSHPRDRSAPLLVEAARSATTHGAWTIAERRWSCVLERAPAERSDDAELRLAEAKRQLGKVDEADALLSAIEERGDRSDELLLERAEVATAAQYWRRAITLWSERVRAGVGATERAHALVRLAEAHRRSGAFAQAQAALDAIGADLESIAARTERAELASARQRWDEACERWEALSMEVDVSELAPLRLAEALAKAGSHERALESLGTYLAGRSPKHEREARALRLVLATDLRERGEVVDDAGTERTAGAEVLYLTPFATRESSS